MESNQTTLETNEKRKALLIQIIEYFMSNQILGIVYAEALDTDTVAQLIVSMTNDMPDGENNIPGKRITLFVHTEEDKTFIRTVLTFLQEENTTDIHCKMKLPGTEQTIEVSIELKEISTK